MTLCGRVAIGPGTGLIVRREQAIAYVADPAGHEAVIAAFADASDDDGALTHLTSYATDHETAIGFTFAAITWSDSVRIVAFGDLEVRSDAARMTMITGAGSTSWVERTLTPDVEPLIVDCGSRAVAGTDLALGRVVGGGFRAEITVDTHQPSTSHDPNDPPVATPAPPTPSTTPATPTPPEVADDSARLDVLASAGGHDWMEDSLGLRSAPDRNEVTVTPDPPADPPAEPANESPPRPAPDGEPRWPDDPPTVVDEAPMTPQRPLVDARICEQGHANPTERSTCAICRAPIDETTAVVTIPQPVLGLLRLPDGEAVPIDSTLVVGRRPDAAAAVTDGTATTVVVDTATSISRNHIVVRVDRWIITVTDCGSRSGTAISAPGRAASPLDPSVPSEVGVGTTIYLGGPTSLVIEPPPPLPGPA